MKHQLTLLAVLFSVHAFSQSDKPCAAPTLPVNTSCSYTSGTTAGANQQTNPNNGGTPSCSSIGEDVWYSFTAPATGGVTLTTQAGSITDGAMALYSGPCGSSMVELACSDDVNASMPEITTGGLTPGQTYFVRFWEYAGGTGTFDICITTYAPPVAPSNDNCGNATNLTMYPYGSCVPTNGTVNGATSSPQTNGCFGTSDDDVWYKFTATSTTANIALNNITGSTTDMLFSVYSGSCGSLSAELFCSDPEQNSLSELTVGNTYFVRVFTYTSTTGQNSTYDICVTGPPPPPVNDDCSNATSVTVSPYSGACSTVSGTVLGATPSSQANGCFGTSDDDVWYSFTPTMTSVSIDLTNVSGSVTDMYFSVYNGNCGSPGAALLCSDPNSGVVTGLTPGNTYFVRIYTYTSTTGQNSTFDLCIQDPPPPPVNDDCSNATSVTMTPFGICNATVGTVAGGTPSGTATGCLDTPTDDVWYSFTATDDSAYVHTNVTFDADVEILSSCTSSIGCNTFYATNGVTLLTGLNPGNTYFVRIFSEDPTYNTTNDFTLCVTGPPPTPPNDDCSNATPVTMGATCNAVPGFVDGATQSGTTTCGVTNTNDVWYSFVATNDSAYVSRTTAFDSYIEVRTNCNSGAGGSLLCSDDEGSLLVDGLTIGTTYYYRIFSYFADPADGSFTTCVIEPGPTPENVSCPSMKPICSDSPIAFMAETGGEDAETVDPNNNYDCLSSSPNPTWYYLQIANSGALSIDITGSDDVDYAIWGPYTSVADAQSNCNAYPLPKDCSFSGSAVEQVNVANVLTGETYVLLVTNYADVPQMINLSSSPSNTATPDCAIVTLPIEMKSFEVEQSGLVVDVTWTTASELNCDYFDVQKTKDGKSWETIQKIEGAGNSNIINSYTSIDRNPYHGISYYRLKQVDINGDFTYTPVKKVNFMGDDNINIYPQPATKKVNIEWDGFKGSITLIDFSGKNIAVPVQNIALGSYSIDVSQLAQGIYFVKLSNGASITMKKIIVQ